MPKTMRLITLGCKVNQYETQYARELLEHAGFIEADEGQPASLCLVNTCTVTHEGDAKSRQIIRRLNQANPGAALLVMGCYATRDPAAVAELPGVTRVIANKDLLVEELAEFGVTDPLPGISRFDDHQRAFVKVQDGCLLTCSYCIIPTVRPKVRSRSVAEICDEVQRLHEAGYREIVLTGIHLGHYGLDLCKGRPRDQWTRLPRLLDRLASLPQDFRIRLSSLEAAEARDELITTMRNHARICPHLHLCLQSGSDRVLARMKRRYRSAGFLERIRRICAALDNPAISTDVIVGFPGETEQDFEDTCEIVRQAEMMKVHVFSYSPRRGTEAAALPDDVPPGLKAERRRRLEELAEEQAATYRRSLVGRVLDVLVEGADPHRSGNVRGMSCRYVPVTFRGHAVALKRRRVPVRIVSMGEGELIGEPVPDHGKGEPVMLSRRLTLPVLTP